MAELAGYRHRAGHGCRRRCRSVAEDYGFMYVRFGRTQWKWSRIKAKKQYARPKSLAWFNPVWQPQAQLGDGKDPKVAEPSPNPLDCMCLAGLYHLRPSPKPAALRLPPIFHQFYWVAASSRLSFICLRHAQGGDGDGSSLAKHILWIWGCHIRWSLKSMLH